MARFHSTLTWLILILEVLSNNAQSSLQECSGFNFLARPAPHYYTTPDSLLVIPCHAEQLLENDARRTISTTIFVDAFPVTVSGITVNTSSEQYEPHVDSEGRVIGLLIILDEDLVPPSLVRCSVVREGQELCHTGNSTITIGDGRPLPPPVEPYHMMDGFRSVQLQWEAFRTPTFAEITAYVVTYWLRNQTRVQAVAEESPGNVTTLEVMPLAPGSVYEVIVQGKNSFGLGEESRVGEIMTTIGDVSPVPAQVTASVQRLGTITVSWESVSVDLATMTVVSGYVLVLRREGNPQDEEVLVVTVDDPMATSHVLTMLERGRYTVGVASRNMAGQSTVRYTPDPISIETFTTISMETPTGVISTETSTGVISTETSNEVITLPATNTDVLLRDTTSMDSGTLSRSPLVTIIAVVVAGTVTLVVLSVLIFFLVYFLRVKMRRMDALHFSSTSSESPDSPPADKKADLEDTKTEHPKRASSVPLKFGDQDHDRELGNGRNGVLPQEQHVNQFLSLDRPNTRRSNKRPRQVVVVEMGTRI